MSEQLEEYQDLVAFLRDQTLTLGIDGYWEWVSGLNDHEREAVMRVMSDPAFSLQEHQVMPKMDALTPSGLEWRTWLCLMGRGSGKTHTASANTNLLARYAYPGLDGMLVGPTVSHVRDTMIEGESGLLATAQPDFLPIYQPGYSRVVWPNGSKAIIMTADDPQSIRGPSLYWAWADELAKWKHEKSYSNLIKTLRNKHPLGNRLIATTSPISSMRWLRAIEKKPETITSIATSFDNTLGLDEVTLAMWQRDVDTGSKEAREEYLGQWVDETDKLWTLDELDVLVRGNSATSIIDMIAQMDELLLSIDPGGKRDLNGIILIGRKGDHYWILADFTMGGSKSKWLPHVQSIANDYMRPGDRILVETNVNADADEDIRAVVPSMRVERVHQSSHTGSKEDRAERAQLFYANNQVSHFRQFGELHKQMDEFYEVVASKNESPDRVDALVNGLNWFRERPRNSFAAITTPPIRFS